MRLISFLHDGAARFGALAGDRVAGFTPLLPGDVIATGTPGGVGAKREPPLWMKPGDVVEVEIPGVGLLRNPIADAA